MFITLEGGEASGKSTQARLLARALELRGYRVVRSAEPGGTALGRSLRRTVKYSTVDIGPLAEALLFLAARTQLVQEVVRPALSRGDAVVCDRFADSTLAYQGYGRGLDVPMLRHLNQVATGGLHPDITVLLDVPVEAAARRRPAGSRDRFDAGLFSAPEGAGGSAPAGFHHRVRDGFLSMAREEPLRWLVVDGTLPRRAVTRRVWERVEALLAAGGG